MAIQNIAYGTHVAMTVTNLQSLATDASDTFTAWQSDRVDNRTTLADDYEIYFNCPMPNAAAGGDQMAYIYVVPWVHNGSAWAACGNFGTATVPTGTEGTAVMSDPNSMRGPIPVPFKINSQPLSAYFTLGDLFPYGIPDGWSLAFRNNTGQALSTGCVVGYRPITFTV